MRTYANRMATCTHWHASVHSLSVSLSPHTSGTNTTAHAVHYTCAAFQSNCLDATEHAAHLSQQPSTLHI
jgi:hypothetical protein